MEACTNSDYEVGRVRHNRSSGKEVEEAPEHHNNETRIPDNNEKDLPIYHPKSTGPEK